MSEGRYKPHSHQPRNVNCLHQEEHERSGINQRIAVAVTKGLSTMAAVWLVVVFMTVWIVLNALGIWRFDPAPFALLLIIINLPQIASTPLVMVGQSVISRKQELQFDEEFRMTEKTSHDQAVIIQQNNEIIQQNAEIIKQNDEQARMITALLAAPMTTRRRTRKEVDLT
jgi:uncharacterized membrane protein